ncbi:MAG: FAD-binding oxidoreductase [Candidatus Fermentibacter sp.]|nr:FAD-binding oxidoreductase [Candidatus Fermentibacter sp.]
MSNTYDVVVIGAGSAGTPAAMYLASAGLRVLCLDRNASAGQGSNKCAIGGIRATHSEPSKVRLCLDSISTFSRWREEEGDDIGWLRGGYTYVAYEQKTADLLKRMLPVQRAAGLDIDWAGPETIAAIVPGIAREGLLGGTWSPGDGSASPMESVYAFCRKARRAGAEFRFGEAVTSMEVSGGRVEAVVTGSGRYPCGWVVNCSGSQAREVAGMAGAEVRVDPDCHEAGVTEAVERFFTPMVVDIRRIPGSANYYFYQHTTGQVVFCITPDPPIQGICTRETSDFLPLVAPRMVGLLPRLANLKVRRTWRGTYPQTPDGSPLIGRVGPENHVAALGMCGQGFMLGPGTGALVSRLITGALRAGDSEVLTALDPARRFGGEEALK